MAGLAEIVGLLLERKGGCLWFESVKERFLVAPSDTTTVTYHLDHFRSTN